MSLRKHSWKDLTFVAFDIETTGKYPLEAEICELGAVKWQGGRIIDEYQSLIRPAREMAQEAIRIHNITNEMVADAPRIEEQIPVFYEFIQGTVPVAHHAPFDMGFVGVELEKSGLPFPAEPALCTSLLSRQVITNVANHRLHTLMRYFGLEQGTAHRARDDAWACLQVALKCFETVGPQATLEDLVKTQGTELNWDQFSMDALRENKNLNLLLQALRERRSVQIAYQGGSKPGRLRRVLPKGVVRNPKGDFLVAQDDSQPQPKRFYLKKISKVQT